MTLTTAINMSIAATETVAGDVDATVSAFNSRDPVTLANGTGVSQASLKWSDTRTISTTETLDLDALTDALGRLVNFSKIKAIHIRAAAANGSTLVWDLSVAAAFLGPFGGAGAATTTITLSAGDGIMLMAPVTGWTETNSVNDKIKITSTSGIQSYDIEIIGT